MVDDDWIREAGPVEIAINLGRDDNLAVVVGQVKEFQCHIGVDNFSIAPRLNGVDAAELSSGVVDDGDCSAWKANFGMALGGGSASGAVPECWPFWFWVRPSRVGEELQAQSFSTKREKAHRREG